MGTGDLLDFERAWPRHTGAKEIAIRERGLTPARYYVMLRRAAVSIDGQAHDAVTAHRVTARQNRRAYTEVWTIRSTS
jgi:Protein of unknown function (DUF3263).